MNEDNPATIDSVGGVDLRMALLPQRLKAAADYYTVAIGKWHLGARQRANLPGRRGFDHHFGFLTGGEDHFTQVGYEAANAIDLWAADASDAAAREGGAPALDRNGTYSCELYAAEAARVVMAHDPSRPLFMYQAWHDTHAAGPGGWREGLRHFSRARRPRARPRLPPPRGRKRAASAPGRATATCGGAARRAPRP